MSPFDLRYAYDGLLFGLGVFLCFRSYRAVRQYWLVRNTPTATVRAVAIGVAELAGTARQKFPQKSRLCGVDCTFFRFTIEVRRRSSRGGSHWAVQEQGASTTYFHLEDPTGRILVDPLGAQVEMPHDYREVKGGYRYTEWRIHDGDPVYVFGTVRRFADAAADRGARLTEKLRALKKDRERLAAFDRDRDGQLSQEEWDAARASVEQELLAEELQAAARPPEDELVVAAGDSERTFILSDEPESAVARRLLWKGIGLAALGAVLTLGMSVSLGARAGILPRHIAIDWSR